MTLLRNKRITPAPQPDPHKEVYVWDIVVRLFHWLLIILYCVAYLSEDLFLTVHAWAGYAIALLLVIRIIWGIIGTKYARFTDFIYPKNTIKQFIKDTFSLRAKRYLGHNPAGGVMVFALMTLLSLTICFGLILFGIEEGRGPLATTLSGTSHFWGDIIDTLHEFFAHTTLALIVIHIFGVLVESLINHENLAASMINGYKKK